MPAAPCRSCDCWRLNTRKFPKLYSVSVIRRGGEHRVAAGGELVVDERLLIEPVHIKLVVVALHGCVGGVKIVVVAAAPLSLQKIPS